ncbi:MAG: hypothetical protein CMK59_06430, partial [Proteobacteria bacterium]|nr:hypothetical protein [Pseudomonadota bacterium]
PLIPTLTIWLFEEDTLNLPIWYAVGEDMHAFYQMTDQFCFIHFDIDPQDVTVNLDSPDLSWVYEIGSSAVHFRQTTGACDKLDESGQQRVEELKQSTFQVGLGDMSSNPDFSEYFEQAIQQSPTWVNDWYPHIYGVWFHIEGVSSNLELSNYAFMFEDLGNMQAPLEFMNPPAGNLVSYPFIFYYF